jgi:hypothetical protein
VKGGLPPTQEEEEEEEWWDESQIDGRECKWELGGCGHPTGYLRKGSCRNRECGLDAEIIYVDASYISVNVFCLFCQLHDICE